MTAGVPSPSFNVDTTDAYISSLEAAFYSLCIIKLVFLLLNTFYIKNETNVYPFIRKKKREDPSAKSVSETN